MSARDDDPTGDTARELLAGDAGSFAEQVFRTRHPELIKRILAAGDYDREQTAALNQLLEESLSGEMAELPPTAGDHARWQTWSRGHYGKPWGRAPFLWAESYFYRRILAASGYEAEGPRRGVDPFLPMKTAELAETTTPESLSWANGLGDRTPGEAFRAVVQAAVFGNRGDLSFLMTAAEHDAAEQFVADDTDALWAAVTAGPADVGLVLDNAGRELVADLILVDHLLASAAADRVTLHAKPVPYFVSDATPADVDATITFLAGVDRALGERLRGHLTAGRLGLRTGAVWCAPLPFGELVPELAAELGRHSLTIFKGDLNYRRLVGDRAWDPTTSFASVAADFGPPVAAFRTLKSEVVVGLGADDVRRLDQAEPDWRVNGRHGLVQFAPREG